MRRPPPAACVLAAAFAILTAACARAQAQSKCQLLQIGEIPFEARNGRPSVAATINGQPARLVLDTNSQFSFLSADRARRLNLNPVNTRGLAAYDRKGEVAIFTAHLDDLQFGKIHSHGLTIMISGRENPDTDIDGAIGEDLLGKVDLDVDFQGSVVRLLKPKDCAGDQVVYWNKPYATAPLAPHTDILQGDLPAVWVSVNGVRLRAALDTGESSSVITTKGAALAGVKAAGLGDASSLAMKVVLASFQFGDEQIKGAEIRMADLYGKERSTAIGSRITQAVNPEEPQMVLGADFFRAHRVYIARSQNMVYVTYVGGPPFQVEAPLPQPKP